MDDKKIKKDKKLEASEDLKREAEEWRQKYMRALADYQNLEKRVQEEREEVMEQANQRLVVRLLPFLDDLEKAQVFVKDPGLKLTHDNFLKVLTELGIKEIQVMGKEFDPHLAEAVEVTAGEQDNVVVGVVRKGYELHGRVIRVAQVKVSKKS